MDDPYQASYTESGGRILNPRSSIGAGYGRPVKSFDPGKPLKPSSVGRSDSLYDRNEPTRVSASGGKVGGAIPDDQLFCGWTPVMTGEDTAKVSPGELSQLLTGEEGGVTGTNVDHSVADGDLIYLEASIADFAVASISVQVGSAWSGYPKTCAFEGDDPPKQTKAYRLLGKVVAFGGRLTIQRAEAGVLTLGIDVADKGLALLFR